jgi:hypothetical protein
MLIFIPAMNLSGAFSSLVNSSQAWSAFLVSYRRNLPH